MSVCNPARINRFSVLWNRDVRQAVGNIAFPRGLLGCCATMTGIVVVARLRRRAFGDDGRMNRSLGYSLGQSRIGLPGKNATYVEVALLVLQQSCRFTHFAVLTIQAHLGFTFSRRTCGISSEGYARCTITSRPQSPRSSAAAVEMVLALSNDRSAAVLSLIGGILNAVQNPRTCRIQLCAKALGCAGCFTQHELHANLARNIFRIYG